MTEEYWSEFADYAEFAAQRGDHLDSEARRLQTLRNLAMSKAAKAKRKKKKQRSDSAERKMTDAERRTLEQNRIREERQARGARSEQNRRDAANTPAPEAAPPPEKKPEQNEPLRKKKLVPVQEPEIDIALPPEPAARPKEPAKRKTKQKSSKRASAAARYGSTAAARPNRISSGGAVTVGILTGVLIGTVIYGRVQTNEVYTEIARLQAEYDDLVARNVSMKSEMEGELTVKNIKEYAEGTLGLKPLTQSQIEYIALQTEDEVVISEPEDNFFVTVNDYLVSIWEFLRGK